MNLKRILALLLAAVMVFAFAACSSGQKASDDTDAQAETQEDASAAADADASGERKVLRVGMECAYAPYNWTQSTDENGAVPIQDSTDYAYGYDVMMAKHIADELGWELEIYRTDWDSLPLGVQSGKLDCAIAGQSITSERLETVDFTEPYYYASIVALTRDDTPYADAKGVSDLKGAKATSQINTVWYTVCLPQIEDCDIQPAMETAPAMLVALNSGKVDLVTTDMPTAQAALIAYPNFRLLDFNENTEDNFVVSEEEINIGISVQKGNDELREAINSVLSEMTADDFNKMMDEAISVQPLSTEE
ncbi:MAG: transporter substrate-binding domain-containing protein [Clostridia bacterium]|jgi:putative lysine transport system substrate-binding protein|nr:transporter substrate-binding domain-containing protein [Clostridia bacterium]MBQ1434811.1 transporter substrate-binding domain-containing protein [Clostridia bacterium]MBQ4248835.1 transporter substrate-binding domain-containing protein [Clostridia bacterium]